MKINFELSYIGVYVKSTFHQGFLVNKLNDDEGKELYRFCVSDERINRNGWKIITQGIDYKEFLKNPVILLGHEGLPIGIAVNVFEEKDKLFADIWFHEESEESRLTKKLIDANVMKMSSIGVYVVEEGEPIPITPALKGKVPPWKEKVNVFTRTELAEISIVPLPANSGASFKKKISNILSDEEYENFYRNILSNLTQGEEMDLQEAITKNNMLEQEITALREQKTTLEASIQQLTDEKNTLSQELHSIKQQYNAANEKIQELQNLVIEAQVDAEIGRLRDKIKAGENSEENNFKLRRNLIHLLKNKDTLVDADGKSLYTAEIEKIEARESQAYLEQPIQINDANIVISATDPLAFNSTLDRAAEEYLKNHPEATYEQAIQIVKKLLKEKN